MKLKKPELLAPAGNLEKLKFAIIYGADAVYCGGNNFGLRAGADNFSFDELKKGAEFAHNNLAKIYITVNMIPHNEDLEKLPDYLHQLEEIAVDGLIISDPGVLSIIKRNKIEIPLHLSTQANAVNWESVNFWVEQGFERIILARELSKNEIIEIRDKTNVALEMFIHGAMCISYSGRCLLSNYMINRDANRGDCAQPCRWKYYLMEEKRPGEFYPVFEDEKGTYIFNSKDLALINNIPEIIEMGIDSLKIEGRMKSLYYVATITGIYRRLIDKYFKNPDDFELKENWLDEIRKVSHRDYTTGFFENKADSSAQNYSSSSYRRYYKFMGIVKKYDPQNKEALIEVRNKMKVGDMLEIIGPDIDYFKYEVKYIINEDGKRVKEAPHPRQLIRIPISREVKPYYLLRKERDE